MGVVNITVMLPLPLCVCRASTWTSWQTPSRWVACQQYHTMFMYLVLTCSSCAACSRLFLCYPPPIPTRPAELSPRHLQWVQASICYLTCSGCRFCLCLCVCCPSLPAPGQLDVCLRLLRGCRPAAAGRLLHPQLAAAHRVGVPGGCRHAVPVWRPGGAPGGSPAVEGLYAGVRWRLHRHGHDVRHRSGLCCGGWAGLRACCVTAAWASTHASTCSSCRACPVLSWCVGLYVSVLVLEWILGGLCVDQCHASAEDTVLSSSEQEDMTSTISRISSASHRTLQSEGGNPFIP